MAEETNTPEESLNDFTQQSESIAPASIGVNLYKPNTPPAFDVRSVSARIQVENPALRIKDTTTGNAPYHPRKVTTPQSPKYSGLDGLMSRMSADLAQTQDKNSYNKIYAYDSSPKGAHKARYKGYGQATYDKIGFSPEIDNETWFNANTTMYDDWKRMATQSAWPMLKLGFMSPIKSYGKLFGQADIGQDLAEARDYEEYNAIGYSTKGGIGGFAINLQNSAAYSVGILTESVVEGALIGAAVGAVAGEGVGAVPGAAIGGVFEGLSAIARLPKTLFQMSKNLGKMTMNLKKLENLSQVKNAFSNAGRTMGDFINPFSNTAEAGMKYVFNNPDDLTNLARTAKTAGAFWHDIKNINAALSEGRLEGGFTEQNTYDRLYNEYYDKHGEAPSDLLQKEMRKQAKVAGFRNTFKNTLLVNYSNKIAFPSITRAGFMKGLPKFSRTLGTVGPYQLIYDPAKKAAGELAYSAEKISLMNAAKGLAKPATYGKVSLNYFKANLVEGFQETAQDVLADATENYYVNSFKNKDRQNFDYSMATLGAAMKKQISAQGAETFASGFAMGTILGLPGGVKKYLSVGYNKYFKHRNNYDQYIQEREGEVNNIIDALNTMDKNARHFFDPRLNNYVNQMLVGKVADDPENVSPKEAKDASFAGFKSAVRTSLRTGTFDMFIDNFQGYKQASPEDIEAAWNLEPGQGQKALEYIDSATGIAKSIAARWQYAKNKMKHVVDPNKFAENTPERDMAEIYNEAYLTGLDNLVFTGSAFDENAQRLDKMNSKLSSLPTIQNSRFSDFAVLTDGDRLKKEIAMLKTDVELGKTATTPEGKEQYEKQKELLEKLKDFEAKQNGATIDFLKKISERQKAIMQAQEGISNNEAQAQAIEEVVNEYEKAGLQPFEEFKQSYKSLLDTIAGSDQNRINLDREIDDAGGIDELFEMLMDTHVLRNENLNLNKYINLLNSPADFYEHVQRNFEWMKKLYENRQDYYEDVVNNSLLAIQRNTLLEDLADEGIYVDLEEFAEWTQDNRNLPTYFIDQVNNRIINEDSYLYDKYIEKFYEASSIDNENPPVKKAEKDQRLQRVIDNYNQQKEGELTTVKNAYDKSLKELLGYTQDEIEAMKSKALEEADLTAEDVLEEINFIEKALRQLESDNVIEIQAVFDAAVEKGIVKPQEYNIRKEEIFSNEALQEEVAELAQKFVDVEESDAQNAASDVVVLGPILTERLDVLQTYDERKGMEGIPEYIGTKPYEDYTKAVEEIDKKYDALIADAENKVAEDIKSEVEANRPEAMKKTIKQIKDLIDTKEDIVQTKRNYIVDGELHDRMSNRIKTGYDTYGYTGETELVDVYDNTIGAALSEDQELTQEVIDDFIKELVDADLPGVNTNKFTVDIVRDELETLIAPEGTRLTKKTQKQIDNLKSQLSTIESKLASVKDKKRLATLEKQKKRLEEAIKDEETGKYREPFEMTNDNIKSFVLNTVKENAFEESRDAGNILDPMLKDFLDTATSKKPAYDPELMSKEAYDNLFDDETGYLTKFKKMADAGEIYIFTKNLYVHSNNLVDENGKKLPPVAGEIDMIIVDRKGRAFIVDLKTGKVAKWLNYKTRGTKSFEKQIENTMQQTGYSNLLENMGTTVDGIMIFPLEIGFDSKGFIQSANAPTNPSLFAGEEVIGDEGTLPYTIRLDKGNNTQIKNEETGQYENISIDQFMQRLIPVKGRKASQIKTKPVPTEAIPEEERAIADEFMLKMANAKEFDDLTEVALELDEMKPNLSKETYNMLKYQLDTRMSMDLNIPNDVILNTDEIYIFTQPVKALKIPEGYRVKIDMLDPETQMLKISRVGPGRTKSIEMSIKDFTENTMTEEQLDNLPKEEPTYEPSQEEIDLLNESLNNTNEGLSEFEKLAQLEADAYAEGVTLDSLENNFLNQIKCFS